MFYPEDLCPSPTRKKDSYQHGKKKKKRNASTVEVLVRPLVFRGVGCVLMDVSHTYGSVVSFIAGSCTFLEILVCLALIVATKDQHDFYSMDLNLEKHCHLQIISQSD